MFLVLEFDLHLAVISPNGRLLLAGHWLVWGGVVVIGGFNSIVVIRELIKWFVLTVSSMGVFLC